MLLLPVSLAVSKNRAKLVLEPSDASFEEPPPLPTVEAERSRRSATSELVRPYAQVRTMQPAVPNHRASRWAATERSVVRVDRR